MFVCERKCDERRERERRLGGGWGGERAYNIDHSDVRLRVKQELDDLRVPLPASTVQRRAPPDIDLVDVVLPAVDHLFDVVQAALDGGLGERRVVRLRRVARQRPREVTRLRGGEDVGHDFSEQRHLSSDSCVAGGRRFGVTFRVI